MPFSGRNLSKPVFTRLSSKVPVAYAGKDCVLKTVLKSLLFVDTLVLLVSLFIMADREVLMQSNAQKLGRSIEVQLSMNM